MKFSPNLIPCQLNTRLNTGTECHEHSYYIYLENTMWEMQVCKSTHCNHSYTTPVALTGAVTQATGETRAWGHPRRRHYLDTQGQGAQTAGAARKP